MKTGIFGSACQKDKQTLIKRLFAKLADVGAAVYVDRDFYAFLCNEWDFCPPADGILEGDVFDLDVAISVGGDGTFLRTASRINRQEIPILGINTGHLGFLADTGSQELDDTIDEVFKNYYRTEERTLLRLHTREKLFAGYNYALNEVAVLKRDTSAMITIHALLDDDFLASYQADGLIVATPTGSTAYSMSVNGPILVPQSASLVISPVAPHSLNVRPLVVPDTSVITLTIESRSEFFLVSLDGRSEIFPAGASLSIRKADYVTRIIKRHNQTFYQTLRNKLLWGTDVRRTSTDTDTFDI
ncbi:MAG: NAD kinase [Tannerellaceae bacterium]|jgi:NAD+ kinase|nr:NAD kinase [Tannerellaceae bacterium]